MKLTNKTLRFMRNGLDIFRDETVSRDKKLTLLTVPFPYTKLLFGLDKRRDSYPCTMFGHQLVLKIVDELLDCGDE